MPEGISGSGGSACHPAGGHVAGEGEVDMSTWELTQPLLDDIVRRVVEVASPDRIVLFGSGARGQLGPDSNLDLLVIKSGVPHRRRLAQQIYLNSGR